MKKNSNREINTPDWVKDAIFYQLFPDRFARSESSPHFDNLKPWGADPALQGFQGGDLIGLTEKLDYLRDSGFNAIYLNPVFSSPSNHRYHTYDYYNVDPLLGGNEAFRKFLDMAHDKGIKVILDGVFNHCGRGFFQFNHIMECGKVSPYLDWFHIKDFPLYAFDAKKRPNYAAWFGLRELPKFNTGNQEVRDFLLDVAAHWIEFGIDGWRLDVPEEIDDDDFWREFRRRVKDINREAYIVGEIWKDEITQTGERWLQGDQFDAIMNYGFTSLCIRFFIGKPEDRALVEGQCHADSKEEIDADTFARQIEHLLNLYDKEIVYSQYNLLDSHDTARYLTLCGGDKSTLKLTTIFQMTYPGAPSVYYGSEVGLEGGRDPDCRRAMPWDSSQWDMDLWEDYKKLIILRKDNRALRRGDYTTFYTDSSAEVYSFIRSTENEKILIILNNSSETWPVEIAVKEHLTDNSRLQCLLNNEVYEVKDKILKGPAIKPKWGAILKEGFQTEG